MQQAQTSVRAFTQQHNLNMPPAHRLLDLTSELGEVAKEIFKNKHNNLLNLKI